MDQGRKSVEELQRELLELQIAKAKEPPAKLPLWVKVFAVIGFVGIVLMLFAPIFPWIWLFSVMRA